MRRLGAVAAVAVVVGLAAGCSKGKPAAETTLPPVMSSVTPSAQASPTTGPPGTPAPGCVGSVSGGGDPHKAALKAWLCADAAGMQVRLTDAAVEQLNAVPKDIDLQWTFVRCDGTAGSSYCIYRNAFGSDLIFRVPSAPAQKISEVRLDRTIYNTDAQLYTRHFVEAWINGNIQRMQTLSSPAIVSFAATHPAPTIPFTATLSPAEVWIFEVTSSGADYRFVLQNPLGKSNAITELHAY